ncbi:putative calcium/calmodulin-dependent protein kinase [Helianthus annuus]|uniref:Calcium/calmodulin-dependent protein kinase n=1 Tax=Helianthus annuus TaxID=4232 RepID=A0A9K3HGA8_HELAN|nr:putative calcium/calmodulin-dependent protein kinase [Helianthus annuus]
MHPETIIQDLDHCSNKSNDQDEPDPSNNPPESYAVCRTKVAEWLNHNTFIQRKPSVKLCSKPQDPSQTPSSRRSVCTTQRPKLSIIGFSKKPVHQMDGKTNKVENVRLFRNRSEPGRDYCLLITEPVSPKVSCVGRVGSVRVVQGRKVGVWRSFKAVLSNLIYANRVTKVAA